MPPVMWYFSARTRNFRLMIWASIARSDTDRTEERITDQSSLCVDGAGVDGAGATKEKRPHVPARKVLLLR